MRNSTYRISLSLDQLLEAFRQLPRKEKIKVAKELEREERKKTLSSFLRTFATDDLSEDTIREEAEIVRKQAYEKSHKR
jgi:hypothetical protein